MEFKKNGLYDTKTMDGLRRIPLPFKMKKYKETDYRSRIIFLKERKDKKSKTLSHVSNINNIKKEELLKNAEAENKNTRLRTKRIIKIKSKEMSKTDKKNVDIPIRSNNSIKPSKVTEGMSASKLLPSVYKLELNKKYKTEQKEQKNQKEKLITIEKYKGHKMILKYKKVNLNLKKIIKRRSYDIIPIEPHESEKPIVAFEEIDAGKRHSSIKSSITTYNNNTYNNNNNLLRKNETDNKLIYSKKNLVNKSNINAISINPHLYKNTTTSLDEIDKGKYYSISTASDTEYNGKNKINKNETENKLRSCKKNIKIRQYEEIPIVSHLSEKPTVTFEEIDGGKCHSNIETSITSYNKKNKLGIKETENKLRYSNKNIKTKKYEEIPIASHLSEKPTTTFEETGSGKSHSTIKYSITTYNNKKDKLDIRKNPNKKLEIKHYDEIPIVTHMSEKPSVTFEEIDGGKCHSIIKTSNTEYNGNNKEDIKETENKLKYGNKNKKIKQYNEIPIIPHESYKPTIAFEEINAGKLYSLFKTCETDFSGKNKMENEKKLKSYNKNIKTKKYDEIPIIPHESEKPSKAFEETSAGKLYSSICNSLNNYNENNKKVKEPKYCKEKLKIKQYNIIPIIPHKSEKPTICIEEIDGGKSHSIIQTSETNYKEKNINNESLKLKKYIQIPIVAHNSEKPTRIFEENGSMEKYNKKNSIIDYKDNNINQQNNEIIIYESPKPSLVFEEIDAGKLYPDIITSLLDILENDQNKYKEIPIIVHDSEKPSICFEEVNTGMPITLKHRYI